MQNTVEAYNSLLRELTGDVKLLIPEVEAVNLLCELIRKYGSSGGGIKFPTQSNILFGALNQGWSEIDLSSYLTSDRQQFSDIQKGIIMANIGATDIVNTLVSEIQTTNETILANETDIHTRLDREVVNISTRLATIEARLTQLERPLTK